MRHRLFMRVGLLIVTGVLVGPLSAQAQSAIAGVVRDTSGAVMPGVTVEASSPALIEKVRSVVTDAEGQYRVVNLRPGTYSVTFTLPGFSTVKRDGITLEANFTANVVVEMRVGALEETLTVSGEAPVVDVQSTQRQAVLNKELLDALPAMRTFSTNTVPAINRAVDVGGSNSMSHASMGVYGLASNQQDILVDGMSTLSSRNSPGVYYNYGANEEVVYQVGGGNAESTTGGVTVNMIPRQGGNRLAGDGVFIYGTEKLQGDNYTDDLKVRGLPAAQRLYKQYDVNVSGGGPLKIDRLWFFGSLRYWAINNYVPFIDSTGLQAHDDNDLHGFTGRLTGQLNATNKITVYMDRLYKNQGHLGISGSVAPEASTISLTPVPVLAQAKWTWTASNKLLVEAGFSENLYTRRLKYEPEVERPSATNRFGDIAKRDITGGITFNAAPGGESEQVFPAYRVVSSISYVTGSHSIKVGEQWTRAWINTQRVNLHGDLVQQYQNGVPVSVLVSNTPTDPVTNLDFDLGLYAQDSWTIRHMTLHMGVRYERLRGSVPRQTVRAGRFVPARDFAPIPDFPNWTDVSPRLGASYDLFGTGNTALKGSVGKYMQLETTLTASEYNPMVDSTDTRTWADLNGNDIAEDNEIGPPTNNAFGIRRSTNPDPKLKRPYTWLTNVGIQQQLWPGSGLSVAYTRRTFHRMLWTENLAAPHSAYTLLMIPDPRGNGQQLPLYNLNTAVRGLVNEVVTNSDQNEQTYNGVDVSLTSRFGNGTLTLGTSTGQLSSSICEVLDPNLLRFCDQSGNSTESLARGFQTVFRGVGTYRLPHGIRVSGVFQSVVGNDLPTTYVVTRTVVPTLTLASVNIRLDTPGTQVGDRYNQLDFNVAKEFRVGHLRILPKVELFNALNGNPVLTQVTTFGSSLGRPQSILPPRVARFNLQVTF